MGAAGRREPRSSRACCTPREAEDRPEARWLRGAFWRNFQVKYREINDLHKQMLRTSDKVDAMPAGPVADARPRPPLPGPVERLLLARPVRRHLHQPHAARHLRAPDRRRGPGRHRRPGRLHDGERRDLDLDGHDDVRLAGPGQVVTDRPGSRVRGSAAGTSGRSATRLLAVMRRRPEAYHQTLRDHEASAGDARDTGRTPTATTASAPASIHDIVS